MPPRKPLSGQTVGDLVRHALGPRADDLTAVELNRLVRRFVDAGRHAVRAESGTAHQAVRALAASEELRRRARTALALRTAPGYDNVIIGPDWRDARRALDEHRERLERLPDVLGYGLSNRRRDGEEHDERCVTILVSRKLSPGDLRRLKRRSLPRWLRTTGGKQVPVDVVQVGPLHRQFTAGSSLGPPNTQIKGTIGAFAVDTGTGASVSLTAMHVAEGHTRFVVPSPRDDPTGQPLGRFLDGTMQRVDAAKISVDPPATADAFLPGIGPIRGWRPVLLPGDRGKPVRMFGASSGRQRGFIAEPAMALPAEGLEEAILVDIETADGDSGCAIVDSDNLVLGLLVGEIDVDGLTLRAFSPIGLVLELLDCDIPNR